MDTRKSVLVVGLGAALSLAAGASQAGPNELWSFEDDDIDFILDPVTLAPITSGPLAVGQVFTSIFEIGQHTKDGANAIPAGQELTGVAAVQLQSIIPGGIGGVGTVYNFGAYAGGLDSILGMPIPEGGAGEGAAVAMWFNDAPDDPQPAAPADRDLDVNRTSSPASNCTSIGDCVDQASKGDLYQVDGFGLDPDEFWVAVQALPGGGDIGTVLGTNNAILVSAFNFGLSNFFQDADTIGFTEITTGDNCGNVAYVLDGCVQLTGSGTITGGDPLVNGAVAHSDFDALKNTAVPVPEPGTLVLFGGGLGLLAFGARFRKRKA